MSALTTFGVRFGRLVLSYREAQGLSAKELAITAFGDETKRPRISDLENGKINRPRATTIDPLVLALAIHKSEVDACREPLAHSQPAISPINADLPNELLENLAQRFGHENPDAPAGELAVFLKEKAKDFRAMEERLAAMGKAEGRIANLMAAAVDAIANGDFEEADARLADAEDMQQTEHTLTEVRKQVGMRVERGHAALLNGKTEDAYGHFEKAASFFIPFDSEEGPKLRLVLEEELFQSGLRFGTDGMVWSANLLKKNLDFLTKEDQSDLWASTQNCLAISLGNQGKRTDGEAGAKLLADAVKASRAAFEVYNRIDGPMDWAMAQNNLGNALQTQGTRTKGKEGTKLLANSVKAYRDALEVLTRRDHLLHWATTQNNLGGVLGQQGRRTDGEEGTKLLADAIKAFRAALEVRTRSNHPVNWAETQENIALALEIMTDMGAPNSHSHLKEALFCLDNALEIFDPVHMPYNFEKATGIRDRIAAKLAALDET